jgi:fatty acid desaturase
MLWCRHRLPVRRFRRPVFRWCRTLLLLYGRTIVLLLSGLLRRVMMLSVPMVGVFTVIGTVTLRHRRGLG